MMDYDAVLIHPPAIYDFRVKTINYGPIAYTVGESTDQFIIPSIGILSIADYLDRNGYRVIVDNIGERMVTNKDFDVEEYIEKLTAKIFAIELHWSVHSQGAIEIAKLCKKIHPDAMVILGGLTATVFSEEIIRKYKFIDAVIRGEAEKPFLSLIKTLKQGTNLENVANLSFRDSEGNVMSNPLMEPSDNLNEFEFARFDLLEPKRAIFTQNMLAHWMIPICRGCIYNCATCGGSSYSYRKYLGRGKPAFRSPEKIVEDIQKLVNQGVQLVFLFQDPRMGGKEYSRCLINTLQKQNIKLTQLTIELFSPADEEYIKELSNIGIPVALSFSPESLVESVRKFHGRNYSNEKIFQTIKYCRKYNIPIGIHSMIVLAQDTPETIKKNWEMWEKISLMNEKSEGRSPIHYAFGPMILLDPGSLAFDSPSKYGYSLIFNNIEDFIKGMSLPSWHQWISYETRYQDKDSIAKLIIDSIEYSINLRERYKLYNKSEADEARSYFVNANREIIDLVNRIFERSG